MGMEGYSFEKYMELITRYSAQKPGEPEGALIIFADDAEYVGTNGWFRLKFQNKPDNVFERTPQSKDNLIKLISTVKKMGEFIRYDQACNELAPLPETLYFDDDAAWHGAKASTWANTPMARLLRPWQDLVREKLQAAGSSMDQETLKKAWYHLTNSYNSDGQWPPTLPDAPHIVHPFNYGYCFDNLLKAELLAGGVDRSKLPSNAIDTLQEILGIQQELVLAKAAALLKSSAKEEKEKAKYAISLIEKSRDVSSIAASGGKILYASEYAVRAEALVDARRLVGGVLIEKM
jgi:alpha-amylase/alpha-mannosidase (GH57 family)